MLAEALANHYHTLWVPEYAREYLERLDRPYEQKDILMIAKEQLKREQEAYGSANRYLVCDTELIVTKIWSEVKYGSCDPWILDQIDQNRYDLLLLCDIDLPWMDDPLREHPHLRDHLFRLYHDELKTRGFPFRLISGTGMKRLINAVHAIDEHFDH